MNNVIIQSEPKWLRKKAILQMFNIGYRKLDHWTECGYIRSVKFNDDSQQGSKLYHVPDIENLLLKLSAGHKPQAQLGRIKP